MKIATDDTGISEMLAYCGNLFKAEKNEKTIAIPDGCKEVDFNFSFNIKDNYTFKIDYEGHCDKRPFRWNYPGIEGYIVLFYALDNDYNKTYLNIYDPCCYDIYYNAYTSSDVDYIIWEREAEEYGEGRYKDGVFKVNKSKAIADFKKSIIDLFTENGLDEIKVMLAEEFYGDYLDSDVYKDVMRVIETCQSICRCRWIFGDNTRELKESDLLSEKHLEMLNEYREDYLDEE